MIVMAFTAALTSMISISGVIAVFGSALVGDDVLSNSLFNFLPTFILDPLRSYSETALQIGVTILFVIATLLNLWFNVLILNCSLRISNFIRMLFLRLQRDTKLGIHGWVSASGTLTALMYEAPSVGAFLKNLSFGLKNLLEATGLSVVIFLIDTDLAVGFAAVLIICIGAQIPFIRLTNVLVTKKQVILRDTHESIVHFTTSQLDEVKTFSETRRSAMLGQFDILRRCLIELFVVKEGSKVAFSIVVACSILYFLLGDSGATVEGGEALLLLGAIARSAQKYQEGFGFVVRMVSDHQHLVSMRQELLKNSETIEDLDFWFEVVCNEQGSLLITPIEDSYRVLTKSREAQIVIETCRLESSKLYLMHGDNGVGKSTFLKLLAVRLYGRLNIKVRHVISDQSLFKGLKMFEIVQTFALSCPSKVLVSKAMNALESYESGNVSRGQSFLLRVIVAMSELPKVLLIDEGFDSLEHSARVSLLDVVRDDVLSRDAIAIIVSHDHDFGAENQQVYLRISDEAV